MALTTLFITSTHSDSIINESHRLLMDQFHSTRWSWLLTQILLQEFGMVEHLRSRSLGVGPWRRAVWSLFESSGGLLGDDLESLKRSLEHVLLVLLVMSVVVVSPLNFVFQLLCRAKSLTIGDAST
jgi:hypothetical protein